MAEFNHVVEKDGSVSTDKVENAISKIDPGQKDQILSNFQEFQQYLHKRIELAEKIGLNEEQLAKAAEKVADYLAKHEEPRNSEENLLQQLWKVGDQEQRHMLAHMLVKLAQSE
jgi:oligoribonuclease (3'-5' exoribonuclease)